ncbi:MULTISPECIES: PIN domain-containing protein [Methylosinus]|uniref:PIN domain-containing protein n=1 Tax=Methylosinus TaxID=425 RepID=UPI0004667D83|nr:hypothetical protein A8B73_03615 [Methylosinus sp. 3S-1]
MYLLDTNIVSTDAPTKRRMGLGRFSHWALEHSESLYISTITIAEIEAAIARTARVGAATKAGQLRQWLAVVEHFYADRILSFGIDEAREAGAILDRARAHKPGFEDIAIAATAAVRRFTVLTANERHFRAARRRLPQPVAAIAALTSRSRRIRFPPPVHRPSISSRFCTAAPDAPLPRLSSRATSKA